MRRVGQGIASSAQSSSPRAPPRSGASARPPSPETGVALAALLRRDGSRGGDALRFGARYGSSHSLPTQSPAPPAAVR